MNIMEFKYLRNEPEKFLTVYVELIKLARKKETTTYGAIAEMMGLPSHGNYMSREVGQILGEISEWEHSQGRHMLTALVIRDDLGQPGDGFFTFAKELKNIEIENEEEFWRNELGAVFQEWK